MSLFYKITVWHMMILFFHEKKIKNELLNSDEVILNQL
jgi:hypothetical protein